LKICIDARPMQNAHCSRGVGIMLSNLLPEMGRQYGSDPVTLLVQGGPSIPPFFQNEERLVTARLQRPNRFNWIVDQLLLPGIASRSGAGCFLATDFNSYLVPSPGLKVVAIGYDAIPFLFPEVMAGQPLPVRLGWRVNFPKLEKADAVIAISEASKRDLVELFALAPQRVRVVYPGIDHGLFNIANATDKARQAEVLARYGISGPFFFYVGDSEDRKNLHRCLVALAGIREPVRLVLAGKKGPTDQRLLGWIDELGLGQRLLLTGFVPDHDLPPLYGAATAFLFPSLYEGFGLPVVEAMACGCPVITSNISSLPEVAGGAALLVNPSDASAIGEAMVRLLTDAQLRHELGTAGLEQAQRFSWQRTAAEVIGVLREVAGG